MRFRTEYFSGSGVRDAAEVMAYETFELGNTDILEYLCSHQLKGGSIVPALETIAKELDENGYVNDMSWDDKVSFFREVLVDLSKATGTAISYALWLAEPPAILAIYGRGVAPEAEVEIYEESNVVLSDIGFDGALYGYETEPQPLASIPLSAMSQYK